MFTARKVQLGREKCKLICVVLTRNPSPL